ncbi:hypothetical protein O181_118612 [Austropuccinia psidii MF-1]|uniref:Uncharacterized protein n=1 Tax=Austropuccinia psidii MF-1 TaxID=1389203 RepID=A0A9Q3KFN2_9BASI|nr:hypothetical protein [Austropuccinia psidii MF-1]
MPSKRSGASYNRSRSSQKGYRPDYGRSQSVTEGQGSVDDPQKLPPPQEASEDIYKASQKAYNNSWQHKEYHIFPDLWKNCMNSYLTVRKFLGHPSTCKLLNGWHPFIEKKKMMLLTEEWTQNNPPPRKKGPKTASVASSSNSNVKKQPQAQNKGKGKATARATGAQGFSRIPWKMYFIWPEQ